MDRYIELTKLTNQLRVSTRWVEGHSGDQYNEECDRLANEARKALLPPEEQKSKKEKKAKVSKGEFRWNQKPPAAPQKEIWDTTTNKFKPEIQDMRTDRDKLRDLAKCSDPGQIDIMVRVLAELVEREEARK
jgi:hypothetical protein